MRLKLSIGNVLYDLRSQNDLICRENHEKKKITGWTHYRANGFVLTTYIEYSEVDGRGTRKNTLRFVNKVSSKLYFSSSVVGLVVRRCKMIRKALRKHTIFDRRRVW